MPRIREMRAALSERLKNKNASWLDGVAVALEELAREMEENGEADAASSIYVAAKAVWKAVDHDRPAGSELEYRPVKVKKLN